MSRFNWQSWNGGSCPVPEGTLIEYLKRGGSTLYYGQDGNYTAEPETLDWSHQGSVDDIVAFRIMIMKMQKEIVNV